MLSPHNHWQKALSTEIANDDVKQVCFADDSSAVGTLEGVKNRGTI